MKRRRKAYWRIFLAILGTCCLCACAKGEEKENQKVSKTERQELVLWSYYETEEQQKGLDQLVDGFNKSQDKYEACWVFEGPQTEFTKKLSLGVAEDQLPDMVLIDNPDMRTYVNLGLFADVTSYVNENFDTSMFYSVAENSVKYDGKYYGLPFCCNNVGLFYNKTMLAEQNIQPPTTWEEFRTAAKQLSNEEHKGFAMSAISANSREQSAFQTLPWILSTGETIETLGNEGTVKGLTFLQSLVQDGAMSSNCINLSQVDIARQFANGEVAMMENGPWALPVIEKSDVDYGVVKLPIDQTSVVVAGGENFGILKGKNTAGAFAFIKYYYRNDVLLSVNKQTYSLPPIQNLAQEFRKISPEYEVFIQQMDSCITRSAYANWPSITNHLSDAIYGVITEQESPEDAAKDLKTITK